MQVGVEATGSFLQLCQFGVMFLSFGNHVLSLFSDMICLPCFLLHRNPLSFVMLLTCAVVVLEYSTCSLSLEHVDPVWRPSNASRVVDALSLHGSWGCRGVGFCRAIERHWMAFSSSGWTLAHRIYISGFHDSGQGRSICEQQTRGKMTYNKQSRHKSTTNDKQIESV